MSRKRIKPEDDQALLDRIKAEQLIEVTIAETKKAMGTAIVRRYGWFFMTVGFLSGLITGLFVGCSIWS